MNYTNLKVELLLTKYSAMTDQEAIDSLNAKTVSRARESITGSELANATDNAEFAALSATQKNQWLVLCGVDELSTGKGITRAMEKSLFGAGTATRTAIAAIVNETISRAEEIANTLDYSGLITISHVKHARSI